MAFLIRSSNKNTSDVLVFVCVLALAVELLNSSILRIVSMYIERTKDSNKYNTNIQ